MNESIIIISGKPIGKARPRFSKVGQYVKVYSAQAKEEKRIAKEIKAQWRGKPLDCPVVVSMTFAMPITRGSKRVVADMLNGITKHTKKSDIDNLIKWSMDCMTVAGVWVDDAQVFEIEAQKIYAIEPKTMIRVEW